MIYLVVLLGLANSVNAASKIYDSMLYKAVKANNLTKMEELLKKGADVSNYSDRNIWEHNPSLDAIKLLIKYKHPLTYTDNHGLHYCVLQDLITGDTDESLDEKVKYLVDNGADIHCYDYQRIEGANGKFSLIYLLASDLRNNTYGPRMEAVEYILKHGADEDLNTYFFQTVTRLHKKTLEKPLNLAHGNGRLFRLFIKYGTNTNEPLMLPAGFYPIHLGAKYGNLELVKNCVNNDAKINPVWWGMTPIDFAKKNNHDDIVIYLMEHGGKFKKYSDFN